MGYIFGLKRRNKRRMSMSVKINEPRPLKDHNMARGGGELFKKSTRY